MRRNKVDEKIWYDEVEKYKSACKQLEKSITCTMLKYGFMGLKCWSWYPGNAPDDLNISTFSDFLKYLGEEAYYRERPTKEQVCEYSEDEFKHLRDELKDLHIIYGFGACINKDVHKLFHDNYGYTKFSPYDFLDFVYRIDIGEFDEWFKKNNLQININYDYVDYLESTLTVIAESA